MKLESFPSDYIILLGNQFLNMQFSHLHNGDRPSNHNSADIQVA
jgi:hypothetical protein